MVMLIWSILAAPAADVGAEGSARLWQIAVWGAVLTGIVLALGIGIVLARRRYLKFRGPDSKAKGKSKGFGIEQVESLHDSDQISDEEFRILRKAALGLDDMVTKKDNSALSDMSASDDYSSGTGEENLCVDADKE